MVCDVTISKNIADSSKKTINFKYNYVSYKVVMISRSANKILMLKLESKARSKYRNALNIYLYIILEARISESTFLLILRNFFFWYPLIYTY